MKKSKAGKFVRTALAAYFGFWALSIAIRHASKLQV